MSGNHVQGRCPACSSGLLFLGKGGYVTCSVLGCPDPCAASDLLAIAPQVARLARAIDAFHETTQPNGEAKTAA